MLRHGFFFLNEVHKKILMENIDTMEQILQKNKKKSTILLFIVLYKNKMFLKYIKSFKNYYTYIVLKYEIWR